MEAPNKVTNVKIKDICEVLFETAAEGLIVADMSGSICVANPRITEMFGYAEDELLGKKVEILIPQEYHKKHVGHRDGYSHQPTKRSMGIGMDLKAKRKDGSIFPVEVSLNHFDMEGNMMVMALISDVTERKRADEKILQLNSELEKRVEERTQALEESQLLYRTIARNFPNGIISVFDKDLNYVFAEGLEMYKIGITSDELKGTNYLTRLPESIKDDIQSQLKKVFKGENISFEIEDKGRTYMLNAVGLQNAEGDINQILVVEQNITKLKTAEENMRNALEKERYLNDLKSRFVSMASHEFRTPLTSVLSSTSLLSKYIGKTDSAEKQEKHINRIKSSVHHLTAILNDFLSLDKLEEGKVELHPTDFDFKEFAGEVSEEIQEMAKKGQRLNYEHEGETEVYLDKQMLKHILNNLLSNAVKYSPEGKEIIFNTIIDKNSLTIKVKDNGIGIPKEEQAQMFERFFRAKNAFNIQGTGLGLNIVKKYIDMSGGSITFESDTGTGTTFIVKLPLKNNVIPT